MRQSDNEEWDLTRWKQALDARGSAEEQHAYQMLGRYLYRAACKMIGTCFPLLNRELSLSIEELADDFVQETLLQVYQSYPAFQWRSHIRTYATSILHRSILSELRKARMRELPTSFSEPNLEEETADPIPYLVQQLSNQDTLLPEKLLEMKEMEQILVRALNGLSKIQRNSLLLVTVEEKPVVEAAAELGISVDALYKNISRARQSLAHSLGAYARQEENPIGEA